MNRARSSAVKPTSMASSTSAQRASHGATTAQPASVSAMRFVRRSAGFSSTVTRPALTRASTMRETDAGSIPKNSAISRCVACSCAARYETILGWPCASPSFAP